MTKDDLTKDTLNEWLKKTVGEVGSYQNSIYVTPQEVYELLTRYGQALKSQLIKEVEGMRKHKNQDMGAGILIIEVYNQALSDLLTKVKEV